MKRDIAFNLFLICSLSVLPGCGKIVDWGKNQVDQGKDVDVNLKPAKDLIRSARIYDQFELVGGFDALWLTDPVRVVYTDLYSFKRGKNEEQKRVFLRRQLEENNYYISFYVLSLKSFRLGEQDSKWTVFLKIDDKKYSPVEIRVVDLSPEYKDIFGKKKLEFKDPYLVFFNAKDVEGNLIITPATKKISLVFVGLKKQAVLNWDVK